MMIKTMYFGEGKNNFFIADDSWNK